MYNQKDINTKRPSRLYSFFNLTYCIWCFFCFIHYDIACVYWCIHCMMCSDSCKVLSRFETLKPITRKKNGEIYQRKLFGIIIKQSPPLLDCLKSSPPPWMCPHPGSWSLTVAPPPCLADDTKIIPPPWS